MALRLKRGSTADRTQLYFEEGELVYDIDLEQVFVGNGLQSEGGSIGGIAVGNGSGGGGSITGIESTATGTVLSLTDIQSTFTNDIYLDTGTILAGPGDIDLTGSISSESNIEGVNVIATGEFQGQVVGNLVATDTTVLVNAATKQFAVASMEGEGDISIDNANTGNYNINVYSDDGFAALDLMRRSAGDISADPLQYGSIYFGREDLNGAVTTAGINGGNDFIVFYSDSTSAFPESSTMIWRDEKLGLGTQTPAQTLDVRGGGVFTGTVTAPSFVGNYKGTLVADDSTILVDGVNGEIPYAVLGAGTASVGDVLKFDGASWIASADLQGSGGSAATVSGATQANPVVVTTSAAHGFGDGQKVTITDVVGMTELNGNSYFVDTLTLDTFALYSDAGLTSTVDGTAYTAYVSGGSAAPAPASDAVTLDGQYPSYYLDYNNHTNTPTLAAVATSGAYGDLTGTPTLFDGAFSSLTGTPTTVAGYGITDAITTADVGSFTFTGSVLDTSDSSQITITPSMLISSDLTVENNLTVTNKITADTIEVENIITSGAGTPELESATDILLTAGTRVEVTQSPFKLANLTDAQRDALSAENGDMIYNTDDNRYQVYQNGSWVRLDTSPIV